MDEKLFITDFIAFYKIFNGLTVEQAATKAADMGLSINRDYDLVDINYSHITATVTDNGISDYIDCWDDKDCYVKPLNIPKRVIDELSQR